MNKRAGLIDGVALLLALFANVPVGANDAGQCTNPDGCGDDSLQIRKDRLREQLKAEVGEDGSDDEDVRGYDLSNLHRGLSDYFGTKGVTSTMQRHVERTLFARKFPNGAKDDDYLSFGTFLDISTVSSSTWAGSTDFGGKSPWLSSLLNRKALIGDSKPCHASSADADNDDDCIVAATLHTFVKISGNEDIKEEEMALASEFGAVGTGKGSFLAGNIMDMDFARKFDTIVANGILAAVDNDLDSKALPMEDMDLVLKKLISLLKPEGTLWLIGAEPVTAVEGPGAVGLDVLHTLDAAKSLSGEYPKRNLSTKWIKRTLARFGCPVFSSKLFPVEYDLEDLTKIISDTSEWIDELESVSGNFKKYFYEMLAGLESRVEEVTHDGPIFAGENTYIVGAQKRK